jgi:hypothetical protein
VLCLGRGLRYRVCAFCCRSEGVIGACHATAPAQHLCICSSKCLLHLNLRPAVPAIGSCLWGVLQGFGVSLVLEYCLTDLRNLLHLMDGGPLKPALVKAVMQQLLQAIHACHTAGDTAGGSRGLRCSGCMQHLSIAAAWLRGVPANMRVPTSRARLRREAVGHSGWMGG